MNFRGGEVKCTVTLAINYDGCTNVGFKFEILVTGVIADFAAACIFKRYRTVCSIGMRAIVFIEAE